MIKEKTREIFEKAKSKIIALEADLKSRNECIEGLKNKKTILSNSLESQNKKNQELLETVDKLSDEKHNLVEKTGKLVEIFKAKAAASKSPQQNCDDCSKKDSYIQNLKEMLFHSRRTTKRYINILKERDEEIRCFNEDNASLLSKTKTNEIWSEIEEPIDESKTHEHNEDDVAGEKEKKEINAKDMLLRFEDFSKFMSTKEKDTKVARRNVDKDNYGVLGKMGVLKFPPTQLKKEKQKTKLKVRVNLPLLPNSERRAGPIDRKKSRSSSKKMALTAKRKKKMTKNVTFI